MKKIVFFIFVGLILFSCENEVDNYPLEMYSPYTQLSQRYINKNFKDFSIDLNNYYGVFEIYKKKSIPNEIWYDNIFSIETIFRDGEKDRTNYIDFISYNGEKLLNFESITYLSHFTQKENSDDYFTNEFNFDFTINSRDNNFTFNSTNHILEMDLIKRENQYELIANTNFHYGLVKIRKCFDFNGNVKYLNYPNDFLEHFEGNSAVISKSKLLNLFSLNEIEPNSIKDLILEVSFLDTMEVESNNMKFLVFNTTNETLKMAFE